MEKVYMLICVGDNDIVDGKFQATCKTLFKENPLESDKYKKNVDNFLNACFDTEKYLLCCQKGTEKLIVKEMEIV